MPRPRFQRLAPAKRQRIMEAAAREFAAHGYQQASLNQILEEAAISKGAAYYYFDDKADLFSTTVAFYTQDLLNVTDIELGALDDETFWPALASVYEKQLAHFRERPWAFGATKAAARLRGDELGAHPSLQELMAQVEARLHAILQRGQALGVIRGDLPMELLANLFMAVDDAADRWLLDNWQMHDVATLQAMASRVVEGLSRLMAPPQGAAEQEE